MSTSSGKKSLQFRPASAHMAPTLFGLWWKKAHTYGCHSSSHPKAKTYIRRTICLQRSLRISTSSRAACPVGRRCFEIFLKAPLHRISWLLLKVNTLICCSAHEFLIMWLEYVHPENCSTRKQTRLTGASGPLVLFLAGERWGERATCCCRPCVCSSPEELSHGDATLIEHGGDEFCSIEPDIRQIYGSVSQSLQRLLQPTVAHTHKTHTHCTYFSFKTNKFVFAKSFCQTFFHRSSKNFRCWWNSFLNLLDLCHVTIWAYHIQRGPRSNSSKLPVGAGGDITHTPDTIRSELWCATLFN